MSIIIRLQNLPWAADSVDIRRYFSGLSIPEGGVHIVGGEMGDAFIAFSTDEDARLAMEKDGGKIHEMQIKLLLSSRTEMMRVIEKARQQNMALQAQILPIQPPPIPIMPVQQPVRMVPPPSNENDRRRARSPTPPRHRNRDKSPPRDRRRSPDSRRSSSSKRERSRSPVRNFRGGSSRDTDRRGDRFKRDERRYEEAARYRDDRHSSRDPPQDSRKYPDDNHYNRQSRTMPSENYRDSSSNHGYYESSSAVTTTTSSGSYDVPRNSGNPKDYPVAFYSHPSNGKPLFPSADSSVTDKPNVSRLLNEISSSSKNFASQQASYETSNYVQSASLDKRSQVDATAQPAYDKGRRRTRFEPEYAQPPVARTEYASPPEAPFFNAPNPSQQPIASESSRETAYIDKRSANFQAQDSWSRQQAEQAGNSSRWPKKPQLMLDPLASKEKDFVQVVPMDIERSPPQMPQETNAFNLPDQYLNPRGTPPFIPKSTISPRNEDMLREMPSRAPTMQSDRQWPGQPSMTVEIRGFPSDVRAKELVGLFPSASIPPTNICIQANNKGAEKAFIRFINAAEFEKATSVKFGYIRNYRCNIIPCPADAFETAIKSMKQERPPMPKPREEDLVVQMRGLPFSCAESDVAHFFDDLRIVNIFIVKAADGRASGVGFVEMASSKDFRIALTMNGKLMGHRYITLSIASKEHVADAKGLGCVPPPSRSNSPPRGPGHMNNNFEPSRPLQRPNAPMDVPPVDQGSVGAPLPPKSNRPPNLCISLRELSRNVCNEDIVDFFIDLNVVIRAIHLLLDENNRPSGDAFVEVATKRDQEAALSKNGKPMLGNLVSVTAISIQEMTGILNRSAGPIPPPPVSGPLLKTPPIVEKPRRPLIPQPPEVHFEEQRRPDHSGNEMFDDDPSHDQPLNNLPDDRSYFDHPHAERPRPDFPHGERPRPDFPHGERPRPDFPHGEHPRSDFPHGERPRPNFYRGERPHLNHPRGERPRMEPPMRGMRPRMERPGGPYGRMRGPFPSRPRGPGGPPPHERGGPPPGFGAPGCVVSINNLHFNAGLEDLFDFFKEYQYLSKENIIRKFNERGLTTGEACVAFANPRDAQRVVRELNQKTIMGRSLSLSLL